MNPPYLEVVTADALSKRVCELGAAIAADYAGMNPVLVGVLKGSVPFLADLIRCIDEPHEVDFLLLTRFGSKGTVAVAMDTAISLENRHVLLVEDIVDTGLTLSTLRRNLGVRNLASLKTVALLDKVPRRIVEVPLEYRGFEVGDEFLLGYGLDWNGRYRNLPGLWAVMDMDPVPMNLVGVRIELPTNVPILLLRESDGSRYLPIWIGPNEATAIAFALQEVETQRPMTHDLLTAVIQDLGATVIRVDVTELSDGTFFANLVLDREGSEVVISARPSDAIAIAARTDASIFVDRDLLAEAGVEIEEDGQEEEIERFREFLEDITPEDFGSGHPHDS